MARRMGGNGSSPLIVGGGLLALILVALVAALAMNNRFGPDIRTEVQLAESGQTPTIPAATAMTTGLSAATPAARPSSEAMQDQSTAVVTARVTNSATATVPSVVTAVPTRMTLEPQPGPTEPRPSDGIAQLPTRTEYEKVYAHYWKVLAEAYRKSDPQQLEQVLYGPVLDQARQDIQSATAQGRGVDLRIETDELNLIDAKATGFSVEHLYFDSSVWVELDSGTVIPRENPPLFLEQLTFFRKVDGKWMVVATNKQLVRE